MSLLRRKQPQYDTKLIKDALDQLLERCPKMDAAVVSTVDGHMIEKVERHSCPTNRIATMSSSMISLADTMTAELSMGGCRNIIVENEQGLLVMMHINTELVLVSIAHDSSSGMGMLVSSSRVCSETIRKKLN